MRGLRPNLQDLTEVTGHPSTSPAAIISARRSKSL